MQLTLPKNLHTASPITLNTRILVIIGSNGSGKSSFGYDILERYPDQTEIISGMRALFVSTNNEIPVNGDTLSKLQSILKERASFPRLSAYEKLIVRLQKEEFEAAVNYKEESKLHPGSPPPYTKIDQIQEIWEKMFPHNRLLRKSGFIEVVSSGQDGKAYRPERMSDGEKIVFYLIGAILCACPNALLIIEEPEVLLHDSIKNALWDELEELRPDCTFTYLTHDIGFATARADSSCIWIRAYDGDEKVWDYELIESNDDFPEELYLEIVGSRKPILFIEGTETNSIDNRLYPLIFTNYLVKPMGGCQKVIETTKAFRQLKDFHNLDSKGIVDRDRRTQGEIDYLQDQHIYVPNVAEVENLLLLEPVIKLIARRLMRQPDEIFEQVKENVVNLFSKDLEKQIILHVKHRVRKKLEKAINKKITTVEELIEHVDRLRDSIHVDEIYTGIKEKFISYAENKDYSNILKVYNQKGILPQSRLCNLLGINNKESYLNLIISILKEDKEDAIIIRQAIQNSLGIKN